MSLLLPETRHTKFGKHIMDRLVRAYKIVIIFTSIHSVCWKGGAEELGCIAILRRAIKNQHFQSTLLVGRRGSQKRVLCVCS